MHDRVLNSYALHGRAQFADRILVVSNPAMFCIGGVTFGSVATDVTHHMFAQEALRYVPKKSLHTAERSIVV